MSQSENTPVDGEVYALSQREGYTRAEFVETEGEHGAPGRIAWRLCDRFGRGILLTEEEALLLSSLTLNYLKEKDAR